MNTLLPDPRLESVQAFLKEMGEVCRRHGLTLKMDDPHDALEAVNFNEADHKEWIDNVLECVIA